MSRCDDFQEEIATELAIAGRDQSALSSDCRTHLQQCRECQLVLEQELDLNRWLEEPTPLPPGDLVSGVMERIAALQPSPQKPAEPAPPALAWGERMAWAASGAAVMFGLDRLPEASAYWISQFHLSLSSLSFDWQLPYQLSTTTVLVLGAALVLMQGAMVVQIRGAGR